MPTYDYQCAKCGHHFQAFHKMTDNPLEKCPECGGKVEKFIGSGAGLHFKGSGFYRTDYKKSNSSSSNNNSEKCSCCDAAKTCPSAKKENK